MFRQQAGHIDLAGLRKSCESINELSYAACMYPFGNIDDGFRLLHAVQMCNAK